jgi:hypothetical protein
MVKSHDISHPLTHEITKKILVTSSSSLTGSLVSLGSWYGIGTWDFEGRSWLARVQISQAMGPWMGTLWDPGWGPWGPYFSLGKNDRIILGFP